MQLDVNQSIRIGLSCVLLYLIFKYKMVCKEDITTTTTFVMLKSTVLIQALILDLAGYFHSDIISTVPKYE